MFGSGTPVSDEGQVSLAGTFAHAPGVSLDQVVALENIRHVGPFRAKVDGGMSNNISSSKHNSNNNNNNDNNKTNTSSNNNTSMDDKKNNHYTKEYSE